MNGDADRYRALFEGSQASLADMAARQAQALARVGRLRSAMVTILRKNFGDLAAQAEAALGRRLSEIDDEVLIAYLDAFTAAASRDDQRATLAAIRDALAALGVVLDGDEPLLWVEQLHRHRGRHGTIDATPAASALPPAPVQPPPATAGNSAGSTYGFDDSFDDGLDNGFGQSHPVAPVAPIAPVVPPKPVASVDEHWNWDREQPQIDLGTLFADVSPPALWDDTLGNPDPADDRWSPSPIKAQTSQAAQTSQPAQTAPTASTAGTVPVTPSAATSTRPDGRGTRPARQPSQQPTQNDGRTRNPEQGGTPGETPHTSTRTPASKPDGDRPTRQPEHHSGSAPAPGNDSGPKGGNGSRPVRPPAPAPAVVADETWETGTLPASGRIPTPTAPAAPTAATAATAATAVAPAVTPVPASAPVGAGTLLPLRPEITPPAKKARKSRTVRTQAHAPVPLPGAAPTDTAPAAGGPLDEPMRQALLAAASIPRPVFTRDLVSIAGSLETVEAWEAECRTSYTTSPVRFIAPKARHRLRGRLIAVDRDDLRPGDWWYQAVNRYRAGTLYELGVLLHRVGDEVVSHQFDDDTAVFRLDTPRGLVAVVTVVDPRVGANPAGRRALGDTCEKLLAERLTLLSILTTSGEADALDHLVRTVAELADERRWQPSMPIVAARSWEYADDRGSSAVMVLGT